MAWFSNPIRSDSADVRQPENAATPDHSRLTIYGHERDVADKLPDGPRAKLLKLRTEADDLRALARIPYDKAQEIHAKEIEVDRRIRDLVRRQGHAEDHPLVVAERASLEKFRAERIRLSDEHARRREASDPMQLIVRGIESYVATLRDGVAAAPPIAPKLLKGETPAAAVERVRAELVKLRDEAFDVENSTLPAAEAKKRARAQIEAMAAAGRPNVLELLEGRRKFSLPKTRGPKIQLHSGDGAVAIADDVFDAEAVFAWLHRDALIAAVDKAIDEDADDSSALSDEERAQRLVETKAKILATEREEEFFICKAAEDRITIPRRGDADVRAILGLSDSAPAPRND